MCTLQTTRGTQRDRIARIANRARSALRGSSNEASRVRAMPSNWLQGSNRYLRDFCDQRRCAPHDQQTQLDLVAAATSARTWHAHASRRRGPQGARRPYLGGRSHFHHSRRRELTNMTEKQLAEFFIEQRVVEPSQAEDVLREVELNGKTVAQAIEMSGTTLRVALVDPFDLTAAEDLRFALGKDIHVVVSPSDQIEDLIKQHYGTDTTSMDEVLKQLGQAGELLSVSGGREGNGEAAVEAEANATPIIRFVDLILYQAIQDRASDIHFEPFENEF